MSKQPFIVVTALLSVLWFINPLVTSAQSPLKPGKENVRVDSITLEGNRVWSRSRVLEIINQAGIFEGAQLKNNEFQKRVSRSVKRLNDEQFFSDIQVRLEGNSLTYTFEEHPRVVNIAFRGNNEFGSQKLLDVILLQRGDPASKEALKQARDDIDEFYNRKGFGRTSVNYRLEESGGGRVVVVFRIKEGTRKQIADVFLEYAGGKNPFFQIGQNWSLKWGLPITSGEPYSPEKVLQAKQMIRSWYHNRGHLEVSITEETRELTNDRGLELILKIDEGPVYYRGDVSFLNNTIFSDTQLRRKLPLREGDVFNRRQLIRGLQKIERTYQDRGYANASVFDSSRFRIQRDAKKQRANIMVRVKEGKPFFVEKIELRGNEVTYDKVIMREVTLEEGALLDGRKQRNSLRRLRNLGYFKSVEMNLDPGTRQNTKIVRIRVQERPTGQLSFGGGFSSTSGFVGNFSVSKDNFSLYDWSNGFTGRGQSLSVSASIGDERNNFNLSWDDPWFNSDLDNPHIPSPDVPISLGWSLFNTERERIEDFDEIRSGGSIRMGREFGSALSNSVQLQYSFQSIEVDGLLDSDADDPPEDFLEEAITSGDSDGFTREIGSIDLSLIRDRRDDSRFPSQGYLLQGSTRLASELFGGNSIFYSPEFEVRGFIPFWGGSFWATRFNYRTIDTWEDEGGGERPIPSFEEFFLGGSDDIRGYEEDEIAIFSSGGNREQGGRTSTFVNLELRRQIIEETMQAFVFWDSGNVYENSFEFQLSDIKSSVGIGFQIQSPIGPIDISWATRLNETFPGADDQGETQLDFNIGSSGF